MKTSESINQISPALLAAQKQTNAAVKGSINPSFENKYADINSVIEACKAPLNENGITILQPHKSNELGNFVETILLHKSGEWMQSETRVVCAKPNDPQAFGSAITYARRYGLQSFNLLPAEDDDGESAMSRNSSGGKPKTMAPKSTKTPPVDESELQVLYRTRGEIADLIAKLPKQKVEGAEILIPVGGIRKILTVKEAVNIKNKLCELKDA